MSKKVTYIEEYTSEAEEKDAAAISFAGVASILVGTVESFWRSLHRYLRNGDSWCDDRCCRRFPVCADFQQNLLGQDLVV